MLLYTAFAELLTQRNVVNLNATKIPGILKQTKTEPPRTHRGNQ